MTNHFTVSIRLAAAQMLTAEDVSGALETVQYQLESLGDQSPEGYTRSIRDINGNTVGQWTVVDKVADEVIAQQVLKNHAMDGHPDWMRSVEQIAPLLAEAVRITRGEE